MSDPKMPPQVQALFDALKAKGIEVEVVNLGGDESGPVNSKEELAALLSKIGAKASADVQPTKSEAAMLSTIAHGLAHLAKHLEPQIVDVDGRSLRRDNQMRDSISELTERVKVLELDGARYNQELFAAGQLIVKLTDDLADLNERHRKQVGLLHKRVTKRKVEVKAVKAKTSAVKGSVTRLRNSVNG